jgi:hypothetical protein
MGRHFFARCVTRVVTGVDDGAEGIEGIKYWCLLILV